MLIYSISIEHWSKPYRYYKINKKQPIQNFQIILLPLQNNPWGLDFHTHLMLGEDKLLLLYTTQQ